ncbi:hypothetical protein WICMUC_005311 [Wickerhamomyces mucosus]|uniref:Uncharacterized protein n=1 Tax=Wickerhamomyces mucosus TaxID=1378264 RepID=A0A9P8PA92_9ASCO|nr:hypothetical protein WICMUC_005311 [Wickerhamomyces mucosus]
MVTITEIKDEVQNDLSKVNKKDSVTQQLYEYSQTPLPALLQSSLLLLTPWISSQPQSLIKQSSSGSLLTKSKRIGPSTPSALLFGSALGLGSFIIHDGDLDSGSGFITAWSTLYLIVNGRSTFNGLLYGRPWPLVLTTVSGVNAYTYGHQFFFGGNKESAF